MSSAASNLPPVPSSSHIPLTLQSFYSFDHNSSTWSPKEQTSTPPLSTPEYSAINLLTWNIDYTTPLPNLRLKYVLSYVEQLLSPVDAPKPPQPTIVLLQEFHYSCFPLLLSSEFIRNTYDVTDISTSSWRTDFAYGTITLIPKSLGVHVTSVFRTLFPESQMGRDALYIDLDLPLSSQVSPDAKTGTIKTKIRIANTHLESLTGHGDRARVVQLRSISQFLSAPGICGGLVGGDMNPISRSDVNLPEEVGLSDVWLISRRNREGKGSAKQQSVEENKDKKQETEGHTWGYQPPTVWSPKRMDKFLFTGSFTVQEVKVVGVGLKIAGKDVKAWMDEEGRKYEEEEEDDEEWGEDEDIWASDHYGLLTEVRLC